METKIKKIIDMGIPCTQGFTKINKELEGTSFKDKKLISLNKFAYDYCMEIQTKLTNKGFINLETMYLKFTTYSCSSKREEYSIEFIDNDTDTELYAILIVKQKVKAIKYETVDYEFLDIHDDNASPIECCLVSTHHLNILIDFINSKGECLNGND